MPRKTDSRSVPDAYKKRVGAALRAARKAAGDEMTQERLANLAKVDVTTISGIERGENVPSLPVLERIGDVLGRSLDDLLGRVVATEGSGKTEAFVLAAGGMNRTQRAIVELAERGDASPAKPPTLDPLDAVGGQVNDLEDRVDLLTRALRQVLGGALDVAIEQLRAQDRQSGRK